MRASALTVRREPELVQPTALRVTRATVLVLETLLVAARDDVMYGLDLMHMTHLSSGTLYPILMQLVQAGWVESSWQDAEPTVSGVRRRRGYRLTATGVLAARHQLAAAESTRWIPQIREIPST
jgi:PadR family transcriptional regulator, regulatory protein PadR